MNTEEKNIFSKIHVLKIQVQDKIHIQQFYKIMIDDNEYNKLFLHLG